MKQNLIDVAEFEVRAGRGGVGAISFHRDRQVRKGGPDGGDGGQGGSIWLEADNNFNTLRFFSGKDRFEAKAGGRGLPRDKHGKNAEDLVIKVPVGTQVRIKNQESRIKIEAQTAVKGEELADLHESGQRVRVAQGGKGGRGNAAFKSSLETTPKIAEPGTPGEVKRIKLELKLLADVGLIGLPNVGKSTLLSVLTKARPEIADYPFTTLSPNLGVMNMGYPHSRGVSAFHPGGGIKPIVIADIPGLIEDAHRGKGLGTDFLRHIERCRVLVHVLAGNNEQEIANDDFLAETLWKNYQTVRQELGQYSPKLLTKPEIVVVNKVDLLQDISNQLQAYFRAKGISLIAISAVTHEGLAKLIQVVTEASGREGKGVQVEG
ncbi:hypothetical protein A2W24_02575 [Microgenomates group bacterium RBG_16_45_19]|nr:MAG: hypothetical protein A2W24_02575 [Microgenomates group bacterium RBG_16_45_19]